jgi:hypothetical protein
LQAGALSHVTGVPKSIIVSCIDAKLNTGELRFAKQLLEAEALKDELANFHRHVSQTGKLLFEHRSGRHDDLIFSVAIGVWWTTWRCRFRLSYYGVKGTLLMKIAPGCHHASASPRGDHT